MCGILGISALCKSTTFSGKELTPLLLILNPKSVTSDAIKTHFFFFNCKPHFLQCLKHSPNLENVHYCLFPILEYRAFLIMLNVHGVDASLFLFEESLPQNVYNIVNEWFGINLCGYLQ